MTPFPEAMRAPLEFVMPSREAAESCAATVFAATHCETVVSHAFGAVLLVVEDVDPWIVRRVVDVVRGHRLGWTHRGEYLRGDRPAPLEGA